ncbi:SDR family oxidoreductase [Delftia acidovorans]|uniref:SDR family oxidoreductase n=1 Tax=Delftia TaxID=80865 RepID=UPI00020E7F9D|nr:MULTISPECIES: SDR family oxidoreductase [Delftia]PIF38202.1 NAD(P)-dependent dehydrogenase (short-subunit alcohol dehydrogenase family) [Burkholderiales bacterium 23]AEF90540.1 2,4-dienoyl-CoA reductase (NADPH) [Delftia sp. Cs1-4]OBY81702.1 short-chain dehydrogenase [Delftia sp. JD2]PIF66616.1 NAD(P)-dependent dehydrogenase (short-subunit alcohol dehydrogenase family) [Delftia sp. 60]QPR33227.1 SDR family oxidoreductase [Delftia acidovorans]
MFEANLFQGQRVLITGGGTGLGLAMAAKLAELGAELHLCGRRRSVVQQACEMLNNDTGAQAFAHELDIRQPEAVHTVIDRIWAEHGPLTSLVNNAAGNFVSRTEDLSINGFHAISDIVFRGTFYVTQAVGRRWIAEGLPGSVLSIVVTWVDTGSPFVVPSAMSKAGLDAMTKSLAVEWGPKRIRFNAIAPGVIPTQGASQRLRPRIDGNEDSADRRRLDNPTRRLGTGEDIGNMAAFILAPGNTWLNGQTITLDGGDALANGAYFTEYQAWDDADWARARQMAKAANQPNVNDGEQEATPT